MNEGIEGNGTKKLVCCGIALFCAVLMSSCYVPSSRILYSEAVGTLEHLPRKAFVAAYLVHELPEPFQDGYIEAVETELGKLGAAVAVAKITGLELDRNAHIEQQQAFQPDVVLVIRFELKEIYDSSHRGRVVLHLVDQRSGEECWRLLQTFSFSYEPVLKSLAFDGGAKIAREALQAAWSDGVFARPAQAAPADTTRM